MPEAPEHTPAVPQATAPPSEAYADINWDKLFGDDPSPSAQPPQAAPAEPPATPPQAPAAPAPEEFFLDAGSSKYRTREDAAKGYADKDAAIEKLRQYAIEKNGFDPLTGKAVAKPSDPPQEVNYMQDGKRYVDDLVKALSKGPSGAEDYKRVQQRLVEEVVGQAIGPYIPVVREAARMRSVETVATEDPTFREFLRSDDYRKTLDKFPDIRVSIETAEQDPRFAERLPGFYRLAHTASLGLRAQEARNAPATPPVVPAPTAFRPTTPTSTATPITSQPVAGPQAPQQFDEAMRSPDGRRRIIEEAKARGVETFRF